MNCFQTPLCTAEKTLSLKDECIPKQKKNKILYNLAGTIKKIQRTICMCFDLKFRLWLSHLFEVSSQGASLGLWKWRDGKALPRVGRRRQLQFNNMFICYDFYQIGGVDCVVFANMNADMQIWMRKVAFAVLTTRIKILRPNKQCNLYTCKIFI